MAPTQRSRIAIVGGLLVAFAFAAWRLRPERVPEHGSTNDKPAASATAAVEPPSTSAAPAPVELPAVPLPSGSATPLPPDAPRQVRFGVVLFAYRGAEGAPSGAPSKPEALAKAKAALPDAQRDFAETVKKGDRGSTADAGTMPRGVLEPVLEYALFTLKKGEVHPEPLDTPRGYWLVRRNE